MCVGVDEIEEEKGFRLIYDMSMFVCVCLCVCVYVGVCVGVRGWRVCDSGA
jgi:hypothetical protein